MFSAALRHSVARRSIMTLALTRATSAVRRLCLILILSLELSIIKVI